MALGNLVKQWETIMRDDDGVNGTVQVLSQLVWMLFLKVYDIKEDMWELYEDDFTSALPEECRWICQQHPFSNIKGYGYYCRKF